jgi:hypothetical protein
MRIAELSSAAQQVLKAGLDSFMSGLGRQRLMEQQVDFGSLKACGVLAEARLDIHRLPTLWMAEGAALDALFAHLRVCLFDGNRPIGYATLAPAGDGSYAFEHVALGTSTDVVQALAEAEAMPGSDDLEGRLLYVAPLLLSALVLVREGKIDSVVSLSPPYSTGREARDPARFRTFVESLQAASGLSQAAAGSPAGRQPGE